MKKDAKRQFTYTHTKITNGLMKKCSNLLLSKAFKFKQCNTVLNKLAKTKTQV